MSNFISKFITESDGAFSLTGWGKVLCGIVALIIFLLLSVLFSRKKKSEHTDVPAEKKQSASLFTLKQLVFSAVALALAYVLSFVKIVHMPWGGSITLFSMFFVTLIGYWYGPKIGLVSAFAYGVLQFLQGGTGYIVSLLQLALDYFVAFGMLGLSGFFSKRKHGLITGYIVGILGRGAMHSIGGYIFWMEYMPDSFPKTLSLIYPVCYNYAYILAEGVLTVVVLSLPAVKSCFARLKQIAVE